MAFVLLGITKQLRLGLSKFCFIRLRALTYGSKMAIDKTKIEAIVDSVTVKGIARLSLALVVPLSIFGINKLYEMHASIVALETQMTERTSDRYTGSDAIRDGKNYLNLISRNQSDIAELARRQVETEKLLYLNLPNRH